MSSENKIKERFGKRTGLRVPDNYFEQAFAHIASNLPEREADTVIKTSLWHKVRPYIYMAAMFAGIWVMMKVFFHVSSSYGTDNQPTQTELLAYADNDALEIEDLEGAYAVNDFQLEHEVSQQYENFDDLEKELGSLEPEYANMKVNLQEESRRNTNDVAQNDYSKKQI